MLVILQNLLANQKYSDSRAHPISLCATRIAQGVGLDAGSIAKGSAPGGSLRRAIPIFLEERQLRQNGSQPESASFEVQILVLAEEYEALSSGLRGSHLSPAQAGQEVIKRAQGHYDSMIVNAFTNIFGGQAATAGA
jgi:hypothetical protein